MRLEPFCVADRALYESLVFNEDAMRLNFGRVFTADEAALFFSAMLQANAAPSALGFYKVLTDIDGAETFIGMGALNENEDYGAIEIEYMLLPAYWRRGFGTALVERLLKTAKETGLLSAAVALTDPVNLPSQRVLIKNGFTKLRAFENDDGEPVILFQKKL